MTGFDALDDVVGADEVFEAAFDGGGGTGAADKPGDFIELDLLPMIQAKVDGVPVFDAHYGTSNGRYAIKIDRMLTGPDAGWLGAEHE